MYTSLRLRLALCLLAGCALGLYGLVWLSAHAMGASDPQKLRAAQTTLEAEQLLAAAWGAGRGVEAGRSDPLQAAMLGPSTSPITTDAGSLASKVTATNPNFAAAIVDLLRQADVQSGDVVAVTYTGSFPVLDLATIIAVESLGAEPVIVSSVGASNWGATDPAFTILDMESVLVQQGLIAHRSVAAATGGSLRRQPMAEEGRQLVHAAMQRNGVPPLERGSVTAAVSARWRIFKASAAGRPLKAFVNVGGGQISTGGGSFREQFAPGLTREADAGPDEGRGLLASMQRAGVATIQLDNLPALARQFQLPVAPAATPAVGDGGPYHEGARTRILAAVGAGLLLTALVLVRLVILAPVGQRAFDPYFGAVGATWWGKLAGRFLRSRTSGTSPGVTRLARWRPRRAPAEPEAAPAEA